MADPPSTSLVSDAEIEAALAEARAEEFPSLDDNTGKSVVVVPVPGLALRPMPAIAATPDSPSAAAARPHEPATKATDSLGASRGIGERLYRCADTLLWALNRPFGWLPSGARRLIGAFAIATLVISLLAPYALPLLWPSRHP